MTHLDYFKDDNLNRTAGVKRGRLRRENGFHFTKNSPIQTKLRYLKIASKLQLYRLRQILYFCKEYRIRKLHSENDFDFESIDKTWGKILTENRIKSQAKVCFQKITDELFTREKHIEAIAHEKEKSDDSPNKSSHKNSNMKNLNNTLPHTSDNLTKLINVWLQKSNCNHNFNSQHDDQKAYSFLDDDMSQYLLPIKDLDIKHVVGGSLNDVRTFYSAVQCSINVLSNFNKKIMKAQFWFKHATLSYLLDTNSIDQFSTKIMQKDRSAPETHNVMWDPSMQSMRKCRNEYEELIATSAHHSHWMANSKAKEVCAFAKLREVGKLGIRGIDLFPNRIITEKDIPNLVHNGSKLSKAMKASFISAHGKHTASLFTPPKKDLTELYYPFYLLNPKGTLMEEKNLISDFYKSIGSIPSKARYNGFHMATIGRFGARWQITLLNIIKLILLLRYIPTDLKKMARFPIPKPGKANEYRPISLCHDIYCFINGICTKITSKGIEKAGFLHDGIVAYRPGKGCGSLVTIEQSFREDCREHSTPTAQVDEDEEKFFDRIPVEILLAAMRINGFPEQGFLEIKASGMGAKYVDIITKKGIAYAKFVCGLEQGNPDSPTVANLVIKLKHDVWNFISEKVRKIYEKNKNNNQGKYRFNSVDKIDGEVILCKIGYCDDNSKYCFIEDENDLLFLTHYFLQLAGDLSMVTKIGRKGSKSEIQFYNVSADFALKIRKVFSSAWSFVHDSPTQEEVPIKICLKKSELQKFLKLSDYANLEQEEQAKWDTIIFPKAHRHLGLTATLSGITKETSKKTLFKMTDRIKKLKIPHMHHETQVKAFNMLCSSIHSYAPLQVDYDDKELENIDKSVAKILKKSRGLSSSDAKHSLFLPQHMGGMGFKSIQDVDLISVARELEITSNSDSIDSEAFRSRIAAILNYEDNEMEDVQNHAWNAIKKLAQFGIYFRDHSESELNEIFAMLEKLPRYQGIGSGRFKNGTQPYLGKGKSANLEIAYGGIVHRILLKLQAVDWNLTTFEEMYKNINSPINLKRLLKIKKQIKAKKFDELTSYFSCYEWINSNNSTSLPKDTSAWRHIDIGKLLKIKYPSSYWKLSNEEIFSEAQKILSLENVVNETITADDNLPNISREYKIIWDKIMNSKSPIFVATDGSHQKPTTSNTLSADNSLSHHSASSFVLCEADMSNTNNEKPDNWIHLPCLPLLCRISSLPKFIGTETSNVAHAESHAIAMQEWALPPYIPRILVTDSESVRNVCIGLRNVENKKINRVLIRKLMGGISKFITSDILTHLQQRESIHPTHISELVRSTISSLEERIMNILPIAKEWTFLHPTEEDLSIAVYGKWKKAYFDEDISRPIFQVNSHQLNETGTGFNQKKRYPKLTPNLSLLNMNHHADQGAELGRTLNEAQQSSSNPYLRNPPSALRFFFSWEGSTIDKHISEFTREKIFEERLSRLKTKKTQGLLWRTMEHVTATWENLGQHKGWKRSLAGLSRTHTRSLYKSETYRLGCHLDLENHDICRKCDQNIPTKSKDIIKKCASCMWCPNYSTRSCPEGNRNHLFLQCQHTDIASFRNKMTNLIEQKLRYLLTQLQNATNFNSVKNLSKQMEEECLLLQSTSLSKENPRKKTERRFTYIKLNDLMQKYEISNLSEGLSIPCPFFSEAFGILPQSIAKNTKDEDLKVIDVFWLGLVPISIDKIIKETCKPSHFLQFIPNIAACKALSTECLSTWKEITDLIMAKAIGMHRIIGAISKDKEKEYRKKYKMVKGTYRDPTFRAEMNRKRKLLQLSTTTIPTVNPSLAINLPEPPRKILCNGITCNKRNKRWCLDQNFSSNRIEPSKKHCLRCSRFSTSMKHSANILNSIGQNTGNSNLQKLQSTLLHSAFNGIPYRSMMNMLEENKLTSEPSTEAKFNKKQKIKDSQKTICRIITHSFKSAITIESKCEHDKFTTTATKIQEGLTASREILKQSASTSTSNHTKINNSDKKTKNPPVIVLDETPTSSQIIPNDCPTTSSKNVERLQNQVLTDGEFISDDAITMAVEILRQNSEQFNIFIANGLSNIVIEEWSPTAGWERFARIFNSPTAIFSKPNGTYIIPMYRPGHWYLVAVNKINRNSYEGWIIDSLGKGDSHTSAHSKIKEAFAGNRGRFNWHTPQCRKQTENECGPRTIRGISDITRGIKNSVSIGDCITNTTMMNSNCNTYEASTIRREISNMLSSHRRDMRPQRIVYKQTSSDAVKKAGKLRRNKYKGSRRRR